MKANTAFLNGKPDVGNPHAWFDEVEVASCHPSVGLPNGIAARGAKTRRGTLLYKESVGWMTALFAIFAITSAFGVEDAQPKEATAVSHMEGRTKNPNRDPGLFGDYWWANRFLSRRQAIEKVRGQEVDLVLLGDSICHFWE